ncbi:MAG: hypothetical protein EZS28_035370 [Streblomastix strix]|uniref:Uncharacterized protein n=1 Tax=Streblomastix strix TaxID=222440 RepID=A0A5J4UFY7_9EUKA|nr:MAG: hypothetical protein EZS28_035370 [Streblomastix strix]
MLYWSSESFSNYLTNVLLTTSYRSAQGQSSCINIKKGLIAREGIEGDIITPSHLRKMVFEAEKESFLGQNWERNSNSKKNKGANYAWISYDDGVMFYGSIAEGGKYARSVNRINKGFRDDININDITNQKKVDSVNKVQISPVTSHQSPSQSNQLKQDFQFNKMKTEEEIRLEEIEKDNDDKYAVYNIPKISKIKVEYKLNADETASEVSNVTLTGDWLIGCSHAAALRIEIFEKGSDDAKLASIPTNSIQIQDKNINKDSNAALRPVKVILDSAHLAEVVDSGKVIYTIKGDEFSFDLDKKYEARIAYGLNGRKTNNVKVSFKKLK